jgi:hypothetical protein
MRLFRPARRILAPDGGEWEVYVSQRRSRAVRIEAVTFYPHRESLLWTTTVDHAERVLRQISAGLEAGNVVRPLGGVVVGRNG